MTRTFIGTINGVPAIKIAAANDLPPWEIPNTDYGRFRFNSEQAAIGYIRDSVKATLPERSIGYLGNGTDQYFPSGTGQGNFQFWVEDGRIISGNYYGDLWYRPHTILPAVADKIWFHSYDASAWRSIYWGRRGAYGGDWDDWYITKRTCEPGRTPADTRRLDRTVTGTYNQNGVWKTGQMGGAPATQPFRDYIMAFTAFGDSLPIPGQSFGVFATDLPVDNDPYPAVTGNPAPGLTAVRIDQTRAKVAKPGFDALSAPDSGLIVGHDKPPMLVAKTGFFSLAAGAQVNINVDLPITPTTLVDYQVNKVGQALYLPPWPNSREAVQVSYRIVGQQVQFKNDASIAVQVRYFVLADDGTGISSGNAKVLWTENGYVQLRRPGSANSPRPRDILLDSRAAYMPIIDQGYIPIGSFASYGGTPGNRRATINFANDGSWKPYVMARAKYRMKSPTTHFFFSDFYAKEVIAYDYMSGSTFMAQVQDTKVDFFVSTDARVDDAYRTGGGAYTIVSLNRDIQGVRYYVFAVPNTL